jgi:hypothetical protein
MCHFGTVSVNEIMTAKVLMIQGSSSSAGKSLLVTAFVPCQGM